MKLFDGRPIEIFWRSQHLPLTLGVCVSLVDSLQPGSGGFWRMRKANSYARAIEWRGNA
jgi:hypothetical protein